MTDYILGDRGTVKIITDDFYDAEILQVFEELHLDRERIWTGEARLVPEPDNPYEPHSIAVYIDELKIGRLSPEDSAHYWQPITRVVASGYDAIAQLQLSAVLRRNSGENSIESQGLLSLSAPGSLFPLNQTPTQAALLPQGPSMKVLDEKDYADYLRNILPPSGEGRVILTLEANRVRHTDGSLVDTVEVYHDRQQVGRLSTQMSEQLAPVIRYVFERNKLTSAWGTIRGNTFEMSLTVQALRAADIPQDWFEELPNNVPELLPVAETYQIDSTFIPTEGELNRQSHRKKRSSGTAPIHAGYPNDNSGEAAGSLATYQRLALLLGLVGAIILCLGIVLVFWKALVGVIGIVLGASVVFLGLFMGRTGTEDYDHESR